MTHHLSAPQTMIEMYRIEGNYALDFEMHRDSGIAVPQSRVANDSYARRRGLDEFVAHPALLCTHCKRRSDTYEIEGLCITCRVTRRGECVPKKHILHRLWTVQQGLHGANCRDCNRWIEALGSDQLTPAAFDPRRRFVPTDIELGKGPKGALQRLLRVGFTEEAPETAAKLWARLSDSSTSIRAGDSNVLYTTTLFMEYVLNRATRHGANARYSRADVDQIRNTMTAIRRISRALLAAS